MERVESLELANRKLAVFSTRCPEKPTPNEDSAAVIPWVGDAAVLAVADGLGGAARGEMASRLAVETLSDTVANTDPDSSNLRAAILDGIEAANQAVLLLGGGAATTLVVVEINGAVIRPYHIGDSGILVCGNRGKIKLQTVAHSPVGYGIEAGLLNESDAIHHADRHLVSNVIGATDVRIEIGSELKLAKLDTLLLSSDGLLDNLHTEEIVEIIRKGPIRKAAKKLQEKAHERMLHPQQGQPTKRDDLTFILMR